jgi:hypothetical protein
LPASFDRRIRAEARIRRQYDHAMTDSPVERALVEYGMLLVQGQADVPSIADLFAGSPVTTRGYSWDYEPAWRLADELLQRDDVAECKLLRGRRTLVHARLWPAVHAAAVAARPAVNSTLLEFIESRPGASGEECRAALAVDARTFQREKGKLEQWLCVWGDERDDVDYHTHDRAWFPWKTGKIARGAGKPGSIDALLAVVPDARAFPALKHVRR